MTEIDAREWVIRTFDVPRETITALDRFIALLRVEAARQNLVAASTLDHVWQRHIADSAQLLFHAPGKGSWGDFGSGAGLPGLIISAIAHRQVTLVEPRRKRAEFLRGAAEELGVVSQVEIVDKRAETMVHEPFAIISARAFAPLDRLLQLVHRFSRPESFWVLPKGRNAQVELDASLRSWQGDFRIVPSITDPEAGIIVARDVRPRSGG